MLFIVFIIYLLIIKQGLASNQDEESNIELETKLKDLLDIDDDYDSNNNDDYEYENKLYNNAFDQEFAKAALEYIENAETEKSNVIQETKPFQHFNPVEKNSRDKKPKPRDKGKRAHAVNQTDNSKQIGRDGNKKRENVILNKIKEKFYSHKFIISVPVGLSIVGSTCLFSCICTLILRRKIVNWCGCCVSRCCKKKKDSCDDLERGKKRQVSSKKVKKSRPAKAVRAETPVIPATPVTSVASQPSWPRAKSLSDDYVDAATQHVTVVEPSIPTRETIVETPPTGCGCCKKKRAKKKYR